MDLLISFTVYGKTLFLFVILDFAVSCARGPDFKTPPENISIIPGSGYAPSYVAQKQTQTGNDVHFFDVQSGEVSTILTFKLDRCPLF